MKQKNKILITGGSGLLAVNWALAVRDQYSVVLGLHHRAVSLENVESRLIDIESQDSLTAQLEDVKPRVVIHTAGMTNVEECEAEPGLARHVNVVLAENVARVCDRLGVSLVHISTDHLFDGDLEMVDENHPVKPLNIYGKTKAEAELRVLDACSRALVVRTNFFGWGTSYRRSFSDVIVDSLRAGREVSLFEDVYYTPIIIANLVSVVHELVERGVGGVFHVTGDERISKYHFGLKVAEILVLNGNIINATKLKDRKDLVRRPLDMSLSNRKAAGLLERNLGGMNECIEGLRRQEQNGHSGEVRAL